MRILLDHCVDWRVARLIAGHEIVTTRRMGWQELQNGRLLDAAEAQRFGVLLTVDKSLRYQQSMAGRTISVVTIDVKYVDATSASASRSYVGTSLGTPPDWRVRRDPARGLS